MTGQGEKIERPSTLVYSETRTGYPDLHYVGPGMDVHRTGRLEDGIADRANRFLGDLKADHAAVVACYPKEGRDFAVAGAANPHDAKLAATAVFPSGAGDIDRCSVLKPPVP